MSPESTDRGDEIHLGHWSKIAATFPNRSINPAFNLWSESLLRFVSRGLWCGYNATLGCAFEAIPTIGWGRCTPVRECFVDSENVRARFTKADDATSGLVSDQHLDSRPTTILKPDSL